MKMSPSSFIGLLLLYSSSALFSSESHSLILTQDNFESAILNPPIPLFIKLYAPWCGYCMRLAPTWEKVARDLEGRVKFAVLNGVQERSLAYQFPLNGFPSLFFTEDGISFLSYDGSREYQDLKQFALNGFKTAPKSKWTQLEPPPSLWRLVYEDFQEAVIKADKKLNSFSEERGWGKPSEGAKVLAVMIPSLIIMGMLLLCFVKQLRRKQQVSEEKKNQ